MAAPGRKIDIRYCQWIAQLLQHGLLHGSFIPPRPQRQLRGKIPELEKAPEGHLAEHHRFMLRLLWKQLAQQEALIAELDTMIEEQTPPLRLRSSSWTPCPAWIAGSSRWCWPKSART